ncbi:MAG: hypothetical protein AB7P23_12080 [Amphiplicatus sp.]
MTVRHLFYRMVSAGLIEKSEGEYKNVVVRLCGEFREAGRIAWGHIVDESRWIRGVETYENASDALSAYARKYRAPVWDDLPVKPLVLVEKDAMAGHLASLCEEYDAPLLPVKGFCSKTYVRMLAEIAVASLDMGQRIAVFVFGDHDPSGVAAPIGLEGLMAQYMEDILGRAPSYRPWFIRLAINPEQIVAFDLATRPAKPTDSRAKDWSGGCVELDAMRPRDLQSLLESEFIDLLPPGHMADVRQREEEEIEMLMDAAAAAGFGPNV